VVAPMEIRLVSDEELAGMATMKSLESLDLGRSGITDHGLRSVASLANLTSLYVPDTSISDEAMKSITDLQDLEELNDDRGVGEGR
jgi:hypothetical protein